MVRPATFHVAFGMSQGCSWPRWSPTGHLANPECPPQRCRSGFMLFRGLLSRPVWMMVGLATCVPCVRRGRCMNVHVTQHTIGRAALATRGSAAASRYLVGEHQTDICRYLVSWRGPDNRYLQISSNTVLEDATEV